MKNHYLIRFFLLVFLQKKNFLSERDTSGCAQSLLLDLHSGITPQGAQAKERQMPYLPYYCFGPYAPVSMMLQSVEWTNT